MARRDSGGAEPAKGCGSAVFFVAFFATGHGGLQPFFADVALSFVCALSIRGGAGAVGPCASFRFFDTLGTASSFAFALGPFVLGTKFLGCRYRVVLAYGDARRRVARSSRREGSTLRVSPSLLHLIPRLRRYGKFPRGLGRIWPLPLPLSSSPAQRLWSMRKALSFPFCFRNESALV